MLPVDFGEGERVRLGGEAGEPAAGADRAQLGRVADRDHHGAGGSGVLQEAVGVAGGDLGGLVDD
jgi:hypothetical protein